MHVREFKTDGGTKPAVDPRFIRGLSPGRKALFVPGCRPVERRLFVSVNPFYARHVQESSGLFLAPKRLCQGVFESQRIFGNQQLLSYLSSPKPGHITGGSQWGARRGDGAGSGRTVREQKCAPREQSFFAFSKASRTRRLNVSPEAQTSEILCKPMEEQNPRLTTGTSAVYLRFITGTRSALCSWLPTSGTTLFCLCKPFSCKACPGKYSRTCLA